MSTPLVAGSGDKFVVRAVDAQLDLDTDQWADVPIDLTPYTAVVLKYRVNDGVLKTLALTKDPDQVARRGYASGTFGATDLDWMTGDMEKGLLVGDVELQQGASPPIVLPENVVMEVRRRV